MGYYENPPIINSNRGSEMISSAIANAAGSLAQGLIDKGERRRQEEKERKLTIQKLQDRKNETDLFYNDKLTEWSSKYQKTNDAVDAQLGELVNSKISKAADSRIALLTETDPTVRQEYLKNIRNADSFLVSSSKFAKSLAEQTATWRMSAKGAKVGVPGGYVINGKDDKEILDNTAFVEVLGGMDAMYENTDISITDDPNGDGSVVTVRGKHKDSGEEFVVSKNSKDYEKAEAEVEDGILLPVESLSTFNTQAREVVADKKGNIFPGFLDDTRQTIDLDSSGTSGGVGKDVYQLKNAQILQEEAIKKEIGKKSEVTATGYISADSPSRLRVLLDYTLKKGPGWYDDNFKKLTVDEQKKTLSGILTDSAWETLTESLERKEMNGKMVYFNPSADLQIKDKVSAASLRQPKQKEEKPEETLYQEEYFDEIINGYNPPAGSKLLPGQLDYRTRINLAENLNKLTGEDDKYITKEDLYKVWLNTPYKSGKFDTGLTMQEAYKDGKIKGKPEDAFKKVFNGKLFVKGDGGAYRPVKGYDLKTASGRVKLALDQASNATERKVLQKKLAGARLADWMQKNPIKRGESQQQYAIRAQKSM